MEQYQIDKTDGCDDDCEKTRLVLYYECSIILRRVEYFSLVHRFHLCLLVILPIKMVHAISIC
jgi:hypothetical protein